MLYINERGKQLRDDFLIKSNMQEDIDNDTFEGTIFYEDYIETMEDAIGWMLETYDTNALDIIEEWIEISDKNVEEITVWDFSIIDLKNELEKVIY